MLPVPSRELVTSDEFKIKVKSVFVALLSSATPSPSAYTLPYIMASTQSGSSWTARRHDRGADQVAS